MESYITPDGFQSLQNLGNKRRRLLFYGCMMYSFVLVNFILWGGFSLGFFFVLVFGQIALYMLMPKPSGVSSFLISLFFTLCILALGASFVIFSDPWLGIVNLLVILLLHLMQLFVYSQSISFDWDQPGFYIEMLMAPIMRPFVSLGKIWSDAKGPKSPENKQSEFQSQDKTSNHDQSTYKADSIYKSESVDGFARHETINTQETSSVDVAKNIQEMSEKQDEALMQESSALPDSSITQSSPASPSSPSSPGVPLANGSYKTTKDGFPAIIKIVFGLLIALPLFVVVVVLLSSADAVFSIYVRNIWDRLININISEYVFSLIFAACLFPFLCSFMHSYQHRWKARWIQESFSTNRQYNRSGDPLVAGTVLFILNLVYGFFTWIQFQYLFGAVNNVLPAELTYAEYARQGFFQLAAVACINILLVLISVFLIRRGSGGGVLVRLMSVMMILFTWGLLFSAGYRMKMYIDIYALTKLRVLVSLFMVLIGLVLLYALLKEFFIKFRFFKFSLCTAAVVLIATNYFNMNAKIAQYNIAQYQKKTAEGIAAEIDWKYLVQNLSDDAIPYVLMLTDADDTKLARDVSVSMKMHYELRLKNYREGNWKRYNIGKEQAKKAIEKNLDLIKSSDQLNKSQIQ